LRWTPLPGFNIRLRHFRPEFNFPSPDIAFPFTSFAVRTPSADSLQVQIQRLRQEVTEVRRQQLSRQRELQASMGGSAEEAIQRDGRLAALLTREETLLAQQRSLTERLRRVSEEEIQLQWAEAQTRYEEALSRMLGNEREAQRRGAREREVTTSRPAEVYVYARGGSGSPIIAGQSAMLGAHLAPLNPDLAALFLGAGGCVRDPSPGGYSRCGRGPSRGRHHRPRR
jgi:hypothetical protein